MHAAIRRIRQHLCHRRLRARMKMNLRLFEINELVRLCGEKRDEHGQCLRHAEADIRDADHIARIASCAVNHAPDLQFNLRVVKRLRRDFPRQAELPSPYSKFRFCFYPFASAQ
jgi:hypothetical protein